MATTVLAFSLLTLHRRVEGIIKAEDTPKMADITKAATIRAVAILIQTVAVVFARGVAGVPTVRGVASGKYPMGYITIAIFAVALEGVMSAWGMVGDETLPFLSGREVHQALPALRPTKDSFIRTRFGWGGDIAVIYN